VNKKSAGGKKRKKKSAARKKRVPAKSRGKKEVCKVPSKSQTFSIDLLIAASLFVIGAMVFFYVVGNTELESSTDDLARESERIPENLITSDPNSASETAIVIGNSVDSVRLNRTLNKSYDKLKDQLGVKGDFCIHFEDSEGNLIDLDPDPNRERYSIGNPKLTFVVIDENGVEQVVKCGDI
jgi:hypothetical protein